ncbi:sel1 repeat family protein [Burkholderia stabilis]|uniref:Putative lipoprotein n=1 Tax=Burkholderia stabilis TaxID=95485 RepID=A0A1Y1BT54_9BURK|nr:sel1 repeat family protein [Burkholderia stabilis]BAX63094.1 putative lipoprotein [Burkholderia stabilis]
MRRTPIVLLISCLLAACSQRENATSPLPDVSAVRLNLAFTCVHEIIHLPALDPEADKLFQYGRYLQKQQGEKNFNDIARYYRIAAAYGHFKANTNAQKLVSQGLASSPDATKETIAFATKLIDEGVPGGYYDIGHYLEVGYGLKQDAEMALRYFRKAADLGNPEAQTYVAEQLAPHDRAPDIARQMLRCATDQGFGRAASTLGIDQKNNEKQNEAVKAFQSGIRSGDAQSASFLEDGFKGPPPTDRLNYLGLENDPERSRRYEVIWKFLTDNESRNPKVPDLDKIVPLPPAKLPPWDGTFQWQKEQDAATPPQKPSDELVDEMAKAKHLDPATGLTLPGSTDKTSQTEQPENIASRLPLGTVAHTGQPCPEDGVWCAKLGTGQIGDTQRRFLKGDALPSVVVHEPRKLAVLDGMMGTRQHVAQVALELVAYLDRA